jgi:hypothetical protein
MNSQKKSKYGTTVYKNGFVIRKANRRIEYLEISPDHWVLSFVRVRPEKLILQEKAQFDFVEERLGLTYTRKITHLSKEVMEDVALGMLAYLKAIDHKVPNINLQP